MEEFKIIVILLGFAVFVVALFRRIHLPPILGYLFVGMMVGPGGFGIISSIQDFGFLAEFGVVFLMFTIGLEFSWARLLTMRRALLGLGGIQVVLCTSVAMAVGWYLGLDPKTAFVAAGAVITIPDNVSTVYVTDELASAANAAAVTTPISEEKSCVALSFPRLEKGRG